MVYFRCNAAELLDVILVSFQLMRPSASITKGGTSSQMETFGKKTSSGDILTIFCYCAMEIQILLTSNGTSRFMFPSLPKTSLVLLPGVKVSFSARGLTLSFNSKKEKSYFSKRSPSVLKKNTLKERGNIENDFFFDASFMPLPKFNFLINYE